MSTPFLAGVVIGLVAGGSIGFVAAALAAASRGGTQAAAAATWVTLAVEEAEDDIATLPASPQAAPIKVGGSG